MNDIDQALEETSERADGVGRVDTKLSKETGGSGFVNCCAERRKRYVAMGSQNIGTTYQAVFVKTSRYAGPKSLAESATWRG